MTVDTRAQPPKLVYKGVPPFIVGLCRVVNTDGQTSIEIAPKGSTWGVWSQLGTQWAFLDESGGKWSFALVSGARCVVWARSLLDQEFDDAKACLVAVGRTMGFGGDW